jgi:hypothetical protein
VHRLVEMSKGMGVGGSALKVTIAAAPRVADAREK